MRGLKATTTSSNWATNASGWSLLPTSGIRRADRTSTRYVVIWLELSRIAFGVAKMKKLAGNLNMHWFCFDSRKVYKGWKTVNKSSSTGKNQIYQSLTNQPRFLPFHTISPLALFLSDDLFRTAWCGRASAHRSETARGRATRSSSSRPRRTRTSSSSPAASSTVGSPGRPSSSTLWYVKRWWLIGCRLS